MRKVIVVCPECGMKLKKIAYGKPKNNNNQEYYYVGSLISPKLAYYCENCEKAFLQSEVVMKYEKK